MKTIYVLVLSLLFCTGCATLTQDKAMYLSDYGLCRKYLAPLSSEDTRYIAEKEIQRRGISCAGVAERMDMQFQQNMQLLDMSNRLLTPPPQVNCVTHRDMFGNYYTNCR